ncbi:MAG: fructose-specific PTS transporter subunit EIIC [Oscillospiraceae bacterium]|jgi:PTS system fructose-specific IIC component|nr:fructose-specific PTS transporter subunit EIIC [Oscillospiraceae bacterium]
MHIQDLLSPAACSLFASVNSKQAAMEQLICLMARTGCINDIAAFRKNVLEREASVSTGCDGLAIPHGRCAAVTRPALAVMRVAAGCPFNALDHKPVYLFFMIAAPNASTHMQLLSRLAELLLDKSLIQKLMTAPDFSAFCSALTQAEEETEADRGAPAPKAGGRYTAVAVTACPLGIAHTYTAKRSLYQAAEEMGITLKVETHGASGVQDQLTEAEIAGCSGVIVAADRALDLSRFAGKPLLRVPVSDGISRPRQLLECAAAGKAPVYRPEKALSSSLPSYKNIGHWLYSVLMSGVSHMLPFVTCGGVLTALAFLLDSFLAPGAGQIGTNTAAGSFCRLLGQAALNLMFPVLAAYISIAIADRPGLVPGLISGWLASYGYCFQGGRLVSTQTAGQIVSSSGFIGVIAAGFASGLVVLGIKRISCHLPAIVDSLRPMLLYPLLGTAGAGAVCLFLMNPLFSQLNHWANFLLSLLNAGIHPAIDIWIGALLACMMAVDLGGPINKAAYLFGTAALIVNGSVVPSSIMAAVMAGGMVPPLVLAFSTTFFPKLFSPKERQLRLSSYLTGVCFLTEGAIPFAAADPVRVLPSCIAGSACAGALTMLFRCRLSAPYGGIFVVPLMQNGLLFLAAVAVGSFAGMFLLVFLKHRRIPGFLPSVLSAVKPMQNLK